MYSSFYEAKWPLLIAFLRLEGHVVDVFSASKRGGGLSGKRCAVESDMLKGIFIISEAAKFLA